MTVKLTRLFSILILIALTSCKNEDSPQPVVLLEMLNIMETESINRYEINWSEFRSEVLAITKSDQSPTTINVAIKRALTLLEDNHSFYRPTEGQNIYGERSLSCNNVFVDEPNIPEDIGYVRVTRFSGNSNDETGKTFAQDIHEKIRQADHDEIKGWIVDLRSNTGGNMWPMLAGIGPILGDGICGYFIDPDETAIGWSYSDGTSYYDGYPLTQITNPYDLIAQNPKVAILMDNGTASSGEAITAAFIGRLNTKSFGVATCGISTANRSFELSDGSSLVLTVSYMADRNKNKLGTSIEPDVEVNIQNIIQAAIDYIYE